MGLGILMKLMFVLPLALLLLPMPVAPEARATVGCGPTLVGATASGALAVPSDALAYGAEGAAGLFVAREEAAVGAWAECEGGTVYCIVEPRWPECEVCQYVSVGFVDVNCCDYPPGEPPVVGPRVADCASYEGSVGGCTSGEAVALGQVEIVTGAGTFYVDDRNFVSGNGVWVYEEANGLDHLQRGGVSFLVSDDVEVCDDGFAMPDRLIF